MMMQHVAVWWGEHMNVQDWNKEWADRIKLEKFRWHNSQWLDMVENSMDDKDFGIPSDDLPPFLNGDLMHLYPTGNVHSVCMWLVICAGLMGNDNRNVCGFCNVTVFL